MPMIPKFDSATFAGLRFFGRMSASISHDLKNTLSIMNESAGLLEDLAGLAERGRPLDTQRIKQLGATIKRQIQRTDGIVRNMNRFAHSVDNQIKEIGLVEALETLLAICRRLTDARGIAVAIAPCEPDVSIVTRPFCFYQLTWLLLEACMECAGPLKRIELHIAHAPADSVQLVFKGLKTLNPDAARGFPDKEMQDLLALLAGRMEIAMGRQEISTVLPQAIDA
jgi:signal transduction histidine kinase